MKSYWVVAGVGVLVAVIGGVLYVVSDHQLGIIVASVGLVVGVLGLAMRLVMGVIGDKIK